MEYQILQVNAATLFGSDIEKASGHLEVLVNKAIKEGWKPQGGVSSGVKQDLAPYLLQAMIKD